ncbi:hypothetical protein DFJ73DRAFT_871322 [Zopfochytrium polystomum]|nr:hypothetical protein DFJ73DRAFT_871322 [Zopfochytrium polystomum]
MQLEFGDIPVLKDVEEQVQLRVGVSTGSAIGGLVGAKVGKYQLFGEAVQKCMELCRAAPAGTVNVAPETQALMD